MAKSNCEDLKGETSPNMKSLLSVDPCLKVEELLKSCKLESLGRYGCNFDLQEDNNCALSVKHVSSITRSKRSQGEIEQMLHHLEFCHLVGRTVTEDDFHVLYHYSSIDFHDKNALWEHNKRCSVFFVKGFHSTMAILSVCREKGTDDDIVVAFTRELLDRIARHHKTRSYFQFCAGCEYDTKDKCGSWEEVAQSLHPLLALADEAGCVEAIRAYLAGLEVVCPIPPSLAELRKTHGREL